jgi:hypothetical protein
MQQLAQQQQAGQQPQGTVNEQVQQQAMSMAAPQQAPQQMPQQPQPQQAGIAGLPVQDNVTKFGSGGIIAFKDAGGVDAAVEAAAKETDDDDDEATTGEYLKPSREVLAKLEAQAENLRKLKAPSAGESPEVARTRLAKENPALFGSLVKPIGENVESELTKLQNAQAAEYAKQRVEAQKAKPSLFQQLGEAAIGSRGQYGRSALASILGGYSSLANKQEQQALEQEQGLRMKELGLQQAKMDVLNKLDEARRAHAEGRFDDEQKYHVEAAKIANTHNTTVANLLGKSIAAAASVAGREGAADTAARAKIAAARIAASKIPRTTDAQDQVAALMADIKAKNPNMSDVEAKAEAIRQLKVGLASSGISAGVKATSDAVEALGKFALLNQKKWREYSAKFANEDEAKKAYIADYKRDALPPELLPSTFPSRPTAPAAAPAAVGDIKAKVEASGQTYDPSTYEYRVAPDGSIQRKAKAK